MKRASLMLAMLALLGAGRRTEAGIIPVVNAGFEDLTGTPNTTYFDASGKLRLGYFTGTTDLGPGHPNELVTSNPIPGWVVSGTDVGTVASSLAPQGQNMAYIGGSIGGGTILQTLAAPLTPGSYTLQVDVLAPTTVNFAGYDIQLLAGSTVLAEDDNTLAPPSGQFVTSTLTYTASASDPNLGNALTIRLTALTPSFGSQADFDDVRLSGPNSSVVPEPSSLALLGIGSVGLVSFGWRRRKQTVKE
jgi:hypothetical protein